MYIENRLVILVLNLVLDVAFFVCFLLFTIDVMVCLEIGSDFEMFLIKITCSQA